MNSTLEDLSARLDRLEREISAERQAAKPRGTQACPAEFNRGELKTIECLRGAGKSHAAAVAIVLARRRVASH
jgi:hypothetical protein